MDNLVLQKISETPAGTVVAWIVAIVAIISGIVAGVTWLYKKFERIKERKDEYEGQEKRLKEHDEILHDIQESLKRIEERYQTDHEAQGRSLKHDITDACNRALAEGHIKLSTLKSIEEMFEDYQRIYNGNSWVHTLVEKVRQIEEVEYDITVD